MGRNKALLRVRGATLLRRTLAVAISLTRSPVIVVAPPALAHYRHETRGLNVHFVVNAHRAEGLASSIRCAIRTARYSGGLLLIPVDLARLQRRDLQRLVQHWRAAPRRVAARRIDEHGGTPLLLPHHLYADALKIRGEQGLKSLLAGLGSQQRRLLNLPSAAFDVDTPADLAQARRAHQPLKFANAGKN